MGWGESHVPRSLHFPAPPPGVSPAGTPPEPPQALLDAARPDELAGSRERDLENDMTRIALICNKAIRDARALPSDEAAVFLGDAVRAIEKIASKS